MSNRKPKKNASRPDAADRHYRPYTSDELAESRQHRKFLNAVSVLNARLWMCVHFAECTCEALQSDDYYRAYSYFRALEDHYDKTALVLSSRIERCRPEAKSAEKPLKVEVVGQSRSKPRKPPAVQEDSVAVRKRDDNLRVIHEINKRHRDGCGSYPKIIRSMMSDPVWAARMKNRSESSWKRRALESKK